MRTYEMMVILTPTLDEDAVNQFVERVESIVVDRGGTMQEVERWGKRRLAYEIRDLTEGLYVIFTFAGNSDATGELERILKLTDDVMRNMIVAIEQ